MLKKLSDDAKIIELGALGKPVYRCGELVGVTGRWAGGERVVVLLDKEVVVEVFGGWYMTDTIILDNKCFGPDGDWEYEEGEF